MSKKVQTNRVECFNGAVVFEIIKPTLLGSALISPKYDAALEALTTNEGDETHLWRDNVCYFVAITESVEVADRPELADLRAFWEMTTNGSEPMEYTTFFLDNVHHDIYREWLRVASERETLNLFDVPIEQRAPDMLTEEERNDPN
jgi:hypothetical protein